MAGECTALRLFRPHLQRDKAPPVVYIFPQPETEDVTPVDDQQDQHRGQVERALGEPQISDALWVHGLTPQNLGVLSQPDGFAQTPPRPGCQDVIELYLRVREGLITDVRFLTEGCLHTVACASALTTLLKGRDVAQAARLEVEDIEAELEGLDPAHRHCAELAIHTWRAALADYNRKLNSPWEKLYQRK